MQSEREKNKLHVENKYIFIMYLYFNLIKNNIAYTYYRVNQGNLFRAKQFIIR